MSSVTSDDRDEQEKDAAFNLSSATTVLYEEPDQALDYAQEAKTLYNQLGNKSNEAIAWRVKIRAYIGKAEEARNDLRQEDVRKFLKEAEDQAKEARLYFQKAGKRFGEAMMLLALGELNMDFRGLRKRDDALIHTKLALELFRGLGDKSALLKTMEASALLVISKIYFKNNEVKDARDKVDEALRCCPPEEKDLEGDIQSHVAFLDFFERRYEAALQTLRIAIWLYGEADMNRKKGVQQLRLADYHLRVDEPERAKEQADEAMGWLAGWRHKHEVMAYAIKIHALIQTKDLDSAQLTATNCISKLGS
jgi:tetratricopeptide (TPR) repeat protein